MNCTVYSFPQRTPEWDKVRLGRATASRAADILAFTDPPEFTPTGRVSKVKPKELAGRRNYRVDLVLERITGRSQERAFRSQAMQDGIDREPYALGLYQAITGTLLEPVGFICHNELMTGCSPDGVVFSTDGEFIEGGVEAKSPLAATHYEYLLTGKIPSEYLKQITHSLWITGAKWWDWLSYHPEFEEPLQIKLERVTRADVDIDAHEKSVRQFLDEVDRDYLALRTMADARRQLQASLEATGAVA